ncbi:CHAD domain-containing protein [Aromatoleum diolicum]|uniref:CHAD domain-containing protein n=1 Tax=Aromatoleum diolicum TaxID=75796 RepID=A0ABX1QG88_9RHOO|nr:CHAD domain-containing protein [Aromatoleum diolicum]NMG76535.1 CHAD domain-containing protein [Aromatoleum diolicum]
MSQEVELKLTLPRKALPALRRHPLIAGAAKQGNAVTLDNTYFDTPELALKARKIAVRTRRHGRVQLQTVKCAAASTGGLTQRPEWEQAFSGTFDFSAIDAPKVRKLLLRHSPDLAPVFSTRFRRETRLYTQDDTARILMMIDTGEVIAGERREPICELELELVEGQPLDLLLLACRLAADIPLMPGDLSKAERGFRLHLGEPLTPLRAETSTIDANQTPVEAFRSLASSCLRQWQANAVGAATGGTPEFIHQLRVALRRLRSLLDLFAPALPADFVDDWKARLAQNADTFAEARDLDVLYEEILAPVTTDDAGHSGSEAAAVARLAERVRDARDQARQDALRSLDPAAQGRLLFGFSAALYALPANSLIGATDLRTFARLQLDRLLKKVRRRHAAAADRVPAHLHALRIALKRLRYGIEFFAPLMPAKAGKAYLAAVVRAQNALGFINDVDVARDRLAQWAGETPELRAAAAFVCGWHGRDYARLGRRALRDLDRLLPGKKPWGK